jgi:hypothetical protein
VSNNLGGKIVASSSTTSWWEEEITWWRALDPNCDIDDIVLWTQTWAWCNSTLWDWFEYWQAVWDSVWEYNWTLNWTYWCYWYDSTVGNNNTECIFWSSMLSSSWSTKEYFEMKQWEWWTNSNWDSEFDTIWWKLYTWSNSSSACPTWRHVPSDEEWTTLTTYLNWWIICETTTWWQCEWLWWNWHNSKTDSNNLANALKIPLAGYRNVDGSTFYYRGSNTLLWSSTPISTSACSRNLYWGNSTVPRYFNSQSYGFSVRCLKD